MTKTKTKTQPRRPKVSEDTKHKLTILLAGCDQPVTANEVFLAQRKVLGKGYFTIAEALRALAAEGALLSRTETAKERWNFRPNTQGRDCKFYWHPKLGTDVARRSASVFPGVTLADSIGVKQRATGLRPAKRLKVQTGSLVNKAVRPAKAADVQTGNRIERLEKRVLELEAVITSLRKILN